MNLKPIARLFGLICLLASGLLACSFPSVPFISKAEPTTTPRATTRSAHPTFTPRPNMTDTPVATATDQPTDVPPTTVPVTNTPKPTRKPVVQATKPKPTNVPPQPTVILATPKPQYKYSLISHTCEHSGGVHVMVVVYADYKDPGSQQAGIRVIASYAPDAPAFGDVVGVTDEYGAFDYVMSPDAANPYKGTVYAWVVDKNNTRISDVGGPVELNGKNEDAPDTCWIAKFYFAGGK